MGYSYITFGQMKTQLLARLQDSGAVYFTNAATWSEVGLYLIEAIRTWNALANYYRNRGQFALTSGQPFYDLPTQLPALRSYNVFDQEMIAELQLALIEPVNVTSWTGTEMFTFNDVLLALQRRRNQFLVETGCVVTHITIPAPPTPIGRIDLTVAGGSDSIIDVIREAWVSLIPGTGTPSTIYPMFASDEYAGDAFSPNWNITAKIPLSCSIVATPVLQLQLIPIPLDKGILDLLVVLAGADLNPSSGMNGVLMGIPDDWTWVVKYGALADLLLKDGPARDADRASYCSQRWDQGLELARLAPSAVNGLLSEIQTPLQSIFDFDTFDPLWQTASPGGSPNQIAMCGLNLLAVKPVPDSVAPYSCTLDVVENAPVPASPSGAVADAFEVQLGREELEAVLGYAQHVASFKMGGSDFQGTSDLFQAFVKSAATYNDRLTATSIYKDVMLDAAHVEAERRPRRQSDAVGAQA